MKDHEHYMRQAIEIALSNSEAPFGAVLVDRNSGMVVAEGLNQTGRNPVLHGEMDAITNYALTNQNNWEDLLLFTTAEPCCMCQAAIIWAGIREVIYGTSIPELSDMGWNQFDLRAEQVVDSSGFANCQITGGVLASQCDELFRRAIRLKG